MGTCKFEVFDFFKNVLEYFFSYVTKNQFRQCISFLDLNAEEEEKDALEARYCDQNGFRYIVFLDDVTLPEAREGNFFSKTRFLSNFDFYSSKIYRGLCLLNYF